MTTKARLFCCTDFQKQKVFWEEFFQKENVRYVCAGDETCPTTGRGHWQIYFYFDNDRSSKKINKLLGGGTENYKWNRPCRGTFEQNNVYCTKESIAWELGDRPKQGYRTDLEAIQSKIAEGVPEVQIATENFAKWCQYSRAFERYRMLLEPKRMWVTEVLILSGPPGTGKTRQAIENGAEVVEYDNGFFRGYNGGDIVVFDDLKGDHIPRETMLKLTDRYPYMINIKGAERNWKPRRIYITTNEDPTSWYDSAFKRRITNIIYY